MDSPMNSVLENLPLEIMGIKTGLPVPQARTYRNFVEALIQNCAVAMFVIDRDHRVIYWNQSCERLTGIRAAEIIGTTNQWMAFYDHQRPCLSDVLLEGQMDKCGQYYGDFSDSVLTSNGLHAEGWYPDLGGKKRYIIFDAVPILNEAGELVAVTETLQDVTDKKLLEEEREGLVQELRDALDNIRILRGLIPICCSCKKIRDDKGYWNKLEYYLEAHTEAEFTHGVCPECEKKMFPDFL